MGSTVFNAMLPAIATLLLGVVAAWRNDFDEAQATVLNRMVMMYALPLMLFAGIIATPRDQLAGDATLIAIVVVGMLAGFFVPLVIARFVVGRDLMTATLQALAIGVPSVGFVGLPVLGYLFGPNAATIPVAVGALVFVLVQLPVATVLLTAGAARRGAVGGGPENAAGAHIMSALKQPIVWAPILAAVIMVLGVPISTPVSRSITLLGHTTGGVALFASGIVLYGRRVTFNLPIGISVLSRNILIPAIVLGLIALFHGLSESGNEAVLTLAIPSATICVILAVQYRAAEQEMASVLLLSTILSLPTMGVFIWLLGA